MRNLTNALSTILHKIPDQKIGKATLKLTRIAGYYDNHPRFFNDGIVELICLIIANSAIWYFTHFGYAEWSIVVLNLSLITPITFGLKFLAHREWVWKHG